MAEIKLFFNERVHTGQLREAGHELIEKDLNVVHRLLDEVEPLRDEPDPVVQLALVQVAMDSQTLPERLRGAWTREEISFTRLMVEAGIFGYPERIWDGLVAKMPQSGILVTATQAEGFLNSSRTRLANLRSPKLQNYLGTQNWASYVFVENLILRGGVDSRVYLQPQTSQS